MPAIEYSNLRQCGQRYLSDGQVWEWADGCVSIPMRYMSDAERSAWDYALFLASLRSNREDSDRLFDRLCEEGNRHEVRSLRYEQRGMHAEANAHQVLSELFDAAANGLVR